MTKLLFIMMTIIATVGIVQAESQFACQSGELSWTSQSDLIQLDEKYSFAFNTNTDEYPLTIVDTKNIKLDRSKKLIETWTVQFASQKQRNFIISKTGSYQNSAFLNYGFLRILLTIDYKNMRYLYSQYDYHDCNGQILSSEEGDGSWKNIIPKSKMEDILIELNNKYHFYE